MGQKINPISLRLQQTNRHFDSSWYNDYYYSNLINRDLNLQTYFNSILNQLKKPSGRFFIQNFQKKVKIHFFICNPRESRYERSSFFKLQTSQKKFDLKKKKINTHYQFNNSFLKQYSFQESSLSFLQKKKLIRNRQISFKSNFTTYLIFLFQNFKQVEKKNKTNLINLNQFLIRYSLLFSFLKIYAKTFQNAHLLNYKINSFECLLKKSLFYLTAIYLQSKLSIESKQNLIQEKKKKEFKNKAISSDFLQQKINISLQLKQFLKKLNKKSINNINWAHRKIENFFFDKQSTKNHRELFLIRKSPQTNAPLSSSISLKTTAFKQKSFFVIKNSPFREHLESVLSCFSKLKVNTFFYLIKKDKQSALFLADEIVYFLEKRILFRQIKNQILKEIQKKNFSLIQGIRISCSGRGGGKSKKAQRAKKQTFQFGQTSLHVFSSKIDFACKSARTSFGHIGVKVWICYKK